MVGAGSICLGYSGQSLFLPNWFNRRRGLAMGLGLCRRRPRLGHAAALGAAHDRADRLANRLHGDGHSGAGRAGADQPVAAQAARRTSGLSRTATRRRLASARPVSNIVDPDWAAIDWTLQRALRTARFWWIAARLFLRIVYLVRGAGSPDQISSRHRLQPERRGVGAGRGQPARDSRSDRCSGISRTGSGANGYGPPVASALRSASRR